jgi:hypothetical protein
MGPEDQYDQCSYCGGTSEGEFCSEECYNKAHPHPEQEVIPNE